MDATGVLLNGLALAGYRSFGASLQSMAPFSRINLFAGPNNSGKSNILRFIRDHSRVLMARANAPDLSLTFGPNDRNYGSRTLVTGIGLQRNDQLLRELVKGNEVHLQTLNRILALTEFRQDSGILWLDYQGTAGTLQRIWDFKEMVRRVGGQNHQLHSLWNHMRPHMSGGDAPGWLADIILCTITALKSQAVPEVVFVPAFRAIDDSKPDGADVTYDGKGLIHRLAQLERYAPDKPSDGERFESIQDFFRSVVGDSEAKLRIPHEDKTIAVRMNGIDLTLDSLGTGIHQTILLAAMGTVVENAIVCLEEPETHLHPVFQRKLLRYLAEHTSNQYFIATHSAHLLDCGITDLNAMAFRVKLDGSGTRVERVTSGADRANVCFDLGYHASDLVQSNCIIWVEGPSDRIYLKHWLSHVDASLVEGIHFSVMFYGGSLLCYLTGEEDGESEEEFREFIALRRLNRNTVILMDSDKSTEAGSIGIHKQRIVDEFHADGVAWVTAGRTIENYLIPNARKDAFKKAHPNSDDRYGRGGRFDTVTKANRPFNKIKMAKAAVSVPPILDFLDLNVRINEVAEFIRRKNPEQSASKVL